MQSPAGTALRELRESAGLHQTDLAKRLGVASSDISRREMGHRETRPHEYAKLAKAIGVSESQFLDRVRHYETMFGDHAEPANDDTLPTYQRVMVSLSDSILEIFENTPPNKRAEMIETIEALASGLAANSRQYQIGRPTSAPIIKAPPKQVGPNMIAHEMYVAGLEYPTEPVPKDSTTKRSEAR